MRREQDLSRREAGGCIRGAEGNGAVKGTSAVRVPLLQIYKN